jgi:hypothetical protein
MPNKLTAWKTRSRCSLCVLAQSPIDPGWRTFHSLRFEWSTFVAKIIIVNVKVVEATLKIMCSQVAHEVLPQLEVPR